MSDSIIFHKRRHNPKKDYGYLDNNKFIKFNEPSETRLNQIKKRSGTSCCPKALIDIGNIIKLQKIIEERMKREKRRFLISLKQQKIDKKRIEDAKFSLSKSHFGQRSAIMTHKIKDTSSFKDEADKMLYVSDPMITLKKLSPVENVSSQIVIGQTEISVDERKIKLEKILRNPKDKLSYKLKLEPIIPDDVHSLIHKSKAYVINQQECINGLN